MNWQEHLLRHEAFVQGTPVEKPLIGCWINGYFPADQFPAASILWQENQPIEAQSVSFDSFRDDYGRLYQLSREIHDDYFFMGSAYWGIPWLEAISGCSVFAGKKSTWAKPFISSVQDIDSFHIDLDNNPWLDCCIEFTASLSDFSNGRFPVVPPLLRGVGDTASAMMGTEHFITGFMENPEGMERILRICSDLRIEVMKRLENVIPAWKNSHAAGGYPSRMWSEQTVSYYQEDCAALLSPQLFEKHLMPFAEEAAKGTSLNFIHLHSGCLYPVDYFLKSNSYRVIELNIDHDGAGPRIAELIPCFRKIRDAGRGLILWGEISRDEVQLLVDKLGPTGLSIQAIKKNIKEGNTLLKAINNSNQL